MTEHQEGVFEESLRRPTRPIQLAAALLAFIVSVRGEVLPFLPNAVPSAEASESSDAAKTRAIEKKVLAFLDTIESGIDTYVPSEAMRQLIRENIALFRSNAQNPERFSNRDGRDVRFGSEQGFWFDLFPDMSVLMRADTLHRIITVARAFDPNDPSFATFVFHEVEHMRKDNEYRRRIPLDRYHAFATTTDLVAIPPDEAQALALQLEVLNIMMKGKFRKDIEAGRTPKIPTNRRNARDFLLRFGKAYFRNPDRFEAFLRAEYRKEPTARFFDTNMMPEKR